MLVHLSSFFQFKSRFFYCKLLSRIQPGHLMALPCKLASWELYVCSCSLRLLLWYAWVASLFTKNKLQTLRVDLNFTKRKTYLDQRFVDKFSEYRLATLNGALCWGYTLWLVEMECSGKNEWQMRRPKVCSPQSFTIIDWRAGEW